MNKLILSAMLLEKSLKLYFLTLISFSPFLIGYALAFWGMIVSGFKILPHTPLEWGLAVLHYILYVAMFGMANIIAYQHFHRLRLTYKAMLEKLKIRYFQLLVGYILGVLIVFNPLYLIELVTVLRKGEVNITLFSVVIVAFCVTLLNFVIPIMILKKDNPWQALKRSWQLVSSDWLVTFALVVYAATLMLLIEWGLEEFFAYSKQIVSVIFFSLFPCLMVVQCDNLEKMIKKS